MFTTESSVQLQLLLHEDTYSFDIIHFIDRTNMLQLFVVYERHHRKIHIPDAISQTKAKGIVRATRY